MTRCGNVAHAGATWVRRLLCLHAALLPISIAAGQVWAYLASLLFLAGALARPRSWPGYPLGRLVALVAAAVVLSAMLGGRPMYALAKADRLFLFAIPVAMGAMALARPADEIRPFLSRLAAFFLAGCSLKALYDCIRIPVQHLWLRQEAIQPAREALAGAPSFPGLFDLGNMRDPQFYAVALCLLFALWLRRADGYPRRLVLAALAINAVALLLHFKRGAWFSAGLGLFVVSVLSGRRAALFWMLLAVLAAAQVPAVRERILLIPDEFRPGAGGRYALWTEAAPRLFEEYPWGMGWRSVRHEDLQRNSSVVVQPRLNHLHNNILQLRLETGWAGVAAWLALMGAALVHAVRGWRRAVRSQSDWRGPALGVLAALLTLHANGLVEYNAGDAEIFMLMNLLMGLAVAGCLAEDPPRSDGEPTPAALRGC